MDVVRSLALAMSAGLAAWLAAFLLLSLATRVAAARKRALVATVVRRCARPARIALAAVAVLVALPLLPVPAEHAERFRHPAQVLVIASGVWLAVRVLTAGEALVFARVRVDVRDNRRARRMRTQITLVRRVAVALVVVLGLAAVLMTFSTFRTLGTSLFASAGVVGAIAGLAAQTTLSNVFAGMQLAFNGSLRIDDVVVVEGEWGRVEELTLTYVVLHLWDERRLVLPTSHFTKEPFENWTRTEARVLGSVVLHVDYSCPVEELRAEAHRVVEASPLWDRRDWVLQVVDTTPSTMVVRVLASAADAPSAWDLRCELREKLVAYLQAEHPRSLPRLRAEAVVSDPVVRYDDARYRDVAEAGSGRSQFAA